MISTMSLGPGSHASPVRLLARLLLLLALALASSGITAAPTLGAARVLTPACTDVNLRVGPTTSAAAKARISPGATVTVIASILGARWRTDCGGWVAGARWLRISHVDGTPVRSRFGVSYLYAASGTLATAPASLPADTAPPAATPAPTPSPTPTPAPTAPPPAPPVAAPVAAVTDPADPLGGELMRLVNLDRVALGLPAYPIDPTLAAIARDTPFACPTNPAMVIQGRARDLATRSYLTHTVPGCIAPGSTLPYRSIAIVKSVFGYAGARSEILHWNTRGIGPATYRVGCDISAMTCIGGSVSTVQAVAIAQRSFMSSSPHRRSELNTYERFGCGAATVPGTTRTYFACLFSNGGPAGSTLVPPTVEPVPAPPASPTPAPVVTPAPTPAPVDPTVPVAGLAMTAACPDVNLRAGTSTGTAIRARVSPGTVLTVVGTVPGAAWATECPGPVAGSTWYQVTHVNGLAVLTSYGAPYVYAATGVLTPWSG